MPCPPGRALRPPTAHPPYTHTHTHTNTSVRRHKGGWGAWLGEREDPGTGEKGRGQWAGQKVQANPSGHWEHSARAPGFPPLPKAGHAPGCFVTQDPWIRKSLTLWRAGWNSPATHLTLLKNGAGIGMRNGSWPRPSSHWGHAPPQASTKSQPSLVPSGRLLW